MTHCNECERRQYRRHAGRMVDPAGAPAHRGRTRRGPFLRRDRDAPRTADTRCRERGSAGAARGLRRGRGLVPLDRGQRSAQGNAAAGVDITKTPAAHTPGEVSRATAMPWKSRCSALVRQGLSSDRTVGEGPVPDPVSGPSPRAENGSRPDRAEIRPSAQAAAVAWPTPATGCPASASGSAAPARRAGTTRLDGRPSTGRKAIPSTLLASSIPRRPVRPRHRRRSSRRSGPHPPAGVRGEPGRLRDEQVRLGPGIGGLYGDGPRLLERVAEEIDARWPSLAPGCASGRCSTPTCSTGPGSSLSTARAASWDSCTPR